jgi:cytochrome c-type biogenesis protein
MKTMKGMKFFYSSCPSWLNIFLPKNQGLNCEGTMNNLAMTSLLLGLLATTSPCVLPLYPGFLAYLGGQTDIGVGKQRYFLGLFVLAGVLTMMLALGGLIALLAVPVGGMLAYVILLADLLILLLGVALLLDRNPFKSLPQVQIPVLRHPFLNAYLYGLLYGPIALPCSGPLVVSIFALSLTVGEALNTLWVFLWFGLGFGLPLLAISLLSGALQRQLTTLFATHSRAINIIGGLLLVGIALYDLNLNWEMLRLFYT